MDRIEKKLQRIHKLLEKIGIEYNTRWLLAGQSQLDGDVISYKADKARLRTLNRRMSRLIDMNEKLNLA